MSTSSLAAARDSRQRELWDRTAEVAGRLNRAQAELVAIADELIADGHWGDGGFTSPQHYLVVRAGLSPEHAADVVRVARRRAELTDAAAALDAGELSLDQVAVVARHVPGAYQASLTDLARSATVPQLRRAVARHAFPATTPGCATAADGAKSADETTAATAGSAEQDHRVVQPDSTSASEQRACVKPDLSMHYDADGRFQLRYSAPATIGALVEQAVKRPRTRCSPAVATPGRSWRRHRATRASTASQAHRPTPTPWKRSPTARSPR